MVTHSQNDLLKNWHLKLAIFMGIVMPSIAASGAYYSLKEKINQVDAKASERVSEIQLDATKDYVSKEDFKAMQSDLRLLHDDMVEVKTILHKKLR